MLENFRANVLKAHVIHQHVYEWLKYRDILIVIYHKSASEFVCCPGERVLSYKGLYS